MSARYDAEKGYIISIDTPKQFAELIENGQLGVESIELGMFHILMNFQYVDGSAERCKKRGNNYHNKVNGTGSYRPKEKTATPASPSSMETTPTEAPSVSAYEEGLSESIGPEGCLDSTEPNDTPPTPDELAFPSHDGEEPTEAESTQSLA